MAHESKEDLQVLSIEVGKARAACVLLEFVVEILGTEKPEDRTTQMVLHEGLGFFLVAVAEKLREIQAKLGQD